MDQYELSKRNQQKMSHYDLFKRRDYYTKEDLRRLTNYLSVKIYNSTQEFEDHEFSYSQGSGCLLGNGHHQRQKLASIAVNNFVESLKEEYQAHFELDSQNNYVIKGETK